MVFAITITLLYSASTLYHSAQDPKLRARLKILDHACIYLLIAGTYTPFTLVTLHGKWGWTLFGMVWGIAVAGIIIETLTGQKYKKLSLALYLGMGWLIIVAIKPLFLGIPAGGLVLLGSGGLCYTLGVIFYVWKSLFCSHAIWHLFVLGGSVLHFFAVFFYVIP